jgi:four helix bundle protein
MRGMGIARRLSMAARRYQDLDVWLLANELKKKVYALVDRSTARDDRRFCEQIRDSAASAPSNLAEGFACYKHPEFARYARFAKASLTETHNHLGDGVDRHHITRHGTIGTGTLHGTSAPGTLHSTSAPATLRGTSAPGTLHSTSAPSTLHGTSAPGTLHGTSAPATLHGTSAPGTQHLAPERVSRYA